MNETTKTDGPKDPWTGMRILGWAAALIVLIPVGIVVGGLGLLAFLERPLHKPSFLVRLTVDMKVNDEPVHIDRIIKCQTYSIGGGEIATGIGKRMPTRYGATVGAIGKALSDGSAVMMWTPYLCARKKDDATGELIPWEFPKGRLPLMAWTPNADKPDRLEIYPSPVYFEKPYARIRDVKYSVKMAPSGARADPPDEFEWFTHSKLRGENRVKAPILFVGYTFLTLNESQWRGKSPHLDKVLPTLKGRHILKIVYRTDRTRRIFDFEASKTAVQANILFSKHFGMAAGLKHGRLDAMRLFSNDLPTVGHNPAIYPLINVPTVSSARVAKFDGKSISFLNEERQGFYLLKRIFGRKINNDNYRSIVIKDHNLEFIQDQVFLIIFDSKSQKLTRLFLVPYEVFPRTGDAFLKKGPERARGD